MYEYCLCYYSAYVHRVAGVGNGVDKKSVSTFGKRTIDLV